MQPRNELDYIDENGNGTYDYMQEPGEYLIFAQDSDGNGVLDRDADGDGLADCDTDGNGVLDCSLFERNPEYRVVLLPIDADSDGGGIPDRFDPDVLGVSGVRLFENVRLEEMTISPKQPYGNTISWINDMAYSRRRQIDNLRIRLGTELQIPDTEWIVDFDWIWATSKREDDYAEPVSHWTVASMRCQGGQFADTCWNPFSTAWPDSAEMARFCLRGANPMIRRRTQRWSIETRAFCSATTSATSA